MSHFFDCLIHIVSWKKEDAVKLSVLTSVFCCGWFNASKRQQIFIAFWQFVNKPPHSASDSKQTTFLIVEHSVWIGPFWEFVLKNFWCVPNKNYRQLCFLPLWGLNKMHLIPLLVALSPLHIGSLHLDTWRDNLGVLLYLFWFLPLVVPAPWLVCWEPQGLLDPPLFRNKACTDFQLNFCDLFWW